MKALSPHSSDEMSFIQPHGESSILAQRTDVTKTMKTHCMYYVMQAEEKPNLLLPFSFKDAELKSSATWFITHYLTNVQAVITVIYISLTLNNNKPSGVSSNVYNLCEIDLFSY